MNERLSQIFAADAQRTAALLAKDFATLDRVLADDLLYVHSTGVAEDKRLYLERIASGHYVYHELDVKERRARTINGVVFIDGLIHIDVTSGGTPKQIASRYVQAWIERDGRWQMVHWHSAPTPRA
jgi:ketosteroid isomerase-like protein